MQVEKFTAFMKPLISRAPVCRPEGSHSSQGQPCNHLPFISHTFEKIKAAMVCSDVNANVKSKAFFQNIADNVLPHRVICKAFSILV